MKINKKSINKNLTADVAKRGRPRKVEAAPAEKPAKIRKAKSERKVREPKAKKEVKPTKALSAEAKKLFMDVRKPVSLLKKLSKSYSKILSEAMKLGDQKTIDHINKLFGYTGYSYTEGKVNLMISTKVKVPKVKVPKAKIPHAQKEVPVAELAVEAEPAEDIDEIVEKTVAETPVESITLDIPDDPDPANENEVVADVDTIEKLANGEITEDDLAEDEDDEDADYRVNDDDRETDIDDEQADYRREFFGSVADNGDDY